MRHGQISPGSSQILRQIAWRKRGFLGIKEILLGYSMFKDRPRDFPEIPKDFLQIPKDFLEFRKDFLEIP